MKKPSIQYRIHLLGLCFLTALVAYAAITSMMYSFYTRNGLSNLALIDGIFAFAGFGFSNFLVLLIIRKLNLQKALALGFSGLLLYNLNILLTITLRNQNSSFFVIYPINILTSFACGISNSVIWTVMPSYIQFHCDQVSNEQRQQDSQNQNKNSITRSIGLFWSIIMWSSIIGGLINIFVLGFSNQYVYMLLIAFLAALSIIMVYFLVEPFQIKKISLDGESERQRKFFQSVKAEVLNLVKAIKGKQEKQVGFPNIFIYNFIAGMCLNFYPIFINKIIAKSLPLDTQEHEFNKLTAIVFIFQGVGSMLTGLAQNKLYFLISRNKQKLLIWGLSLLQSILTVTMFVFNKLEHTGNYYWTCIIVILAWAIVETHIKTNTQAYVRQYNNGKIEYYSLNILFYSLGSILNYFIQMVDDTNWQFMMMIILGSTMGSIWVSREPDLPIMLNKVENNMYEQEGRLSENRNMPSLLIGQQ